jgi:hypothetical protein
MKKISSVSFAIALLSVVLAVAGCKPAGVDTKQMSGTMDAPVPSDMMPDSVQQALAEAFKYHCHELFSDTVNDISVSSIDEIDETSTEGYGIEVTKGAMSTTFPDIRNTRCPQASYDASTGDLWLASSAMEGTGVRVEWLYQIRFGENGSAYIKTVVNPYRVQQELLQRLRYTVDGETVSLYDGDKLLATATNTVQDMGGFDDDQPLWIGEQLYYDVSAGEPKLVFVPGVKFTTGLVLTYDDMPELYSPVTIDENGKLTIREISVAP